MVMSDQVFQKTPRYQEVKYVLMQDIHNGVYAENDRLPSEHELVKRFNVSRSTIRSALQSMELDGIIYTRQGVGSFVSAGNSGIRLRIDEFNGFYQMIARGGHKPTVTVPKLEHIVFDKRICARLSIPDGSEGFLFKRLFRGDGEPAIYVLEYVPVSSLIDPAIADIIPKCVSKFPPSIVKFADNFCREAIDAMITEISSTRADDPILEGGMPVEGKNTLLRLQEILISKEGEPVIYSDAYVNDDMICFQLLNKRGHGSEI